MGPITVSYKGVASYQEKDADARRIVLRAEGRETRGNGTAAATVTAHLADEGAATHVAITTDLAISGKAAQFGRGVLADVSSNLIAQFARSLEAELTGGAAPTSETGTASAASGTTAPAADDSVDLLKVVALPMAKRYAPVLLAAVAAGTAGFLLGRRKRSSPAAVLAEDLQAALARLLS